MYEYVKRAYGVDPIPGERVRHNELRTKNTGIIAREDPTMGHYVMVRFDHNPRAAMPCHPTALDYLGKADAN